MANNCLLDYLADSPGLIRRDQPSLKTFYFGKIPRARLNALLSCYPPTNKQQVENGNDFRLETRTGKHVISAADAATIMKEAAQPDQPASSQTVCRPSRRTNPFSAVYSGPILARVLIHGGLRSMGVSALRTSSRSSLRPSGVTLMAAMLRER